MSRLTGQRPAPSSPDSAYLILDNSSATPSDLGAVDVELAARHLGSGKWASRTGHWNTGSTPALSNMVRNSLGASSLEEATLPCHHPSLCRHTLLVATTSVSSTCPISLSPIW